MITAVIVDDEKKSREVLKRLIKESDLRIIIVGEADSVEIGYEVIIKELPQLVFLDVEMLDGTGFNLLEKFDKIDFKVIFTTAYDKYAIKAFKYSAVDYLLKPIEIEELEDAVLLANNSIDQEMVYNSQIKTLINNNKERGFKKLVIKSASKLTFVNVNDIIYCEAEGCYTDVITVNDNKFTASKPLKHFDSILGEYEGFFRVSKSCLINLNYIQSYNKDKERIKLENGKLITLAKRRKKDFLEKMDSI